MPPLRDLTAVAAAILALVLFAPQFAGARSLRSLTRTRDLATVTTTEDIKTPPGVAMLVGAQGSSKEGLRVRPIVACDQFVSEDITGPGDFGLVGAPGKNIYICSYSISNGSALQDVQFMSGEETSPGNGQRCSSGQAITARFHLLSNQFVSQGSGIGSLFRVSGRGLCLAVTGPGHVSVNVTYASF